ncbi:hypothetical protein ABG067_006312 [Albugo candida]
MQLANLTYAVYKMYQCMLKWRSNVTITKLKKLELRGAVESYPKLPEAQTRYTYEFRFTET